MTIDRTALKLMIALINILIDQAQNLEVPLRNATSSTYATTSFEALVLWSVSVSSKIRWCCVYVFVGSTFARGASALATNLAVDVCIVAVYEAARDSKTTKKAPRSYSKHYTNLAKSCYAEKNRQEHQKDKNI
jgi:hypothetical protein